MRSIRSIAALALFACGSSGGNYGGRPGGGNNAGPDGGGGGNVPDLGGGGGSCVPPCLTNPAFTSCIGMGTCGVESPQPGMNVMCFSNGVTITTTSEGGKTYVTAAKSGSLCWEAVSSTSGTTQSTEFRLPNGRMISVVRSTSPPSYRVTCDDGKLHQPNLEDPVCEAQIMAHGKQLAGTSDQCKPGSCE
jgi:hypothetical protein